MVMGMWERLEKTIAFNIGQVICEIWGRTEFSLEYNYETYEIEIIIYNKDINRQNTIETIRVPYIIDNNEKVSDVRYDIIKLLKNHLLSNYKK